MKPRLLDLFCGAGGCSVGYARAGFEVVGVDIEPQPNYPFEFYRHDALKVLAEPKYDRPCGGGMVDEDALACWYAEWEALDLRGFDAVHASPPCQAFTNAQKLYGRDHPDLIGPTRELLEQTGLLYVIENVKRAPLRDPEVLEGQMFGLNTHRPRLFETNWGFEAQVLRPPPPRQAKMGRKPKPGEAIQVVGHFSDGEAARDAMGIDWMTRDELAQAIPPAYTEHIGQYLMAHLEAERVAA